LRQTDELQAKSDSGATLTPEQHEKLAKLPALQEELAEVDARLAAL
jgi:hypothetical protein